MIVPIVMESEWQSCLASLPNWNPVSRPLVLVAPHPDDETLAAGGLIASMRARGVRVEVVAVTDGEHAYADADSAALGELREQEQTAALGRLGVEAAHIHRLRMPDSGLRPCLSQLIERLDPLVPEGVHLVAPWPHDFHPDHEACGRAAAAVAARRADVVLTWYLFWTWHRGTIDLLRDLPLASFALSTREQRAKEEALQHHRSQLHRADGAPILPENLLAPARRAYEVFLPA